MKLSLEYLKNMLDMRKTLLYCAQKDLEQALAELDQREYVLAQAESANKALKRQNDRLRQQYVDAAGAAHDLTIEVASLNDINRGLLQVVNELRTQVDWWRQQDSDTGWLCANDYQPCVHREQSDDNTCQHFPQEEVFVRVMNNDPEDTTLPGWAEVSEGQSS